MITSVCFKPCDANETDLDVPLFKCSIPSSVLGKVSPSVLAYDDIDVYWLPTEEYPEPDDAWLRSHFPTADEICSGIRQAFDEYHDSWCGKSMVPEIVKHLDGEALKKFQEDRWISFLAVDSIYVNAARNVIWLDTDIDYDLDYNLEEHGVSVIRLDDQWEFGYGGDASDYFYPE